MVGYCSFQMYSLCVQSINLSGFDSHLRLDHLLLLHQNINGRQVAAGVVAFDLLLEFVHPRVDVVAGLVDEDLAVGIKQALALVVGRVLQHLKLLGQLGEFRRYLGRILGLGFGQLLAGFLEVVEALLVRRNFRFKRLLKTNRLQSGLLEIRG